MNEGVGPRRGSLAVGRGRRRLLGLIGTALLVAFFLLAAPPPTASASAEDLIVFDDDSNCEVRMQNVHASSTVAYDASVAVDVRCHPAGAPGADLVVDEITAQTTISYSDIQPIPGLLPAEPIGTCDKIVFANRATATLPCHQPARDAGYYVGDSTVTVTFRGVTEETQVSKQDFFGPVV